MGKAERNRAEREARRIAHEHTQREEGCWIGEAGDHPVAQEIIRRYKEAAKDLRACPHLQENFDQARFWVEAVPELLACKDCTPVIAAKEKAQANTLCVMCRKHVKLRGVSVATGGVLMRGGICAECEREYGGLTP